MVQGGNESLLRGINIAAVLMEGVDHQSLQQFIHALEQVGATVPIISSGRGTITETAGEQDSSTIQVHATFDEADALEYSGVFIPAGARHAELLQQDQAACQLISDIADAGKPIGACAEGVAVLLDSGILQDRTVAAPEHLKDRLAQAGATLSGNAVEVDGLLVTCASKEATDQLTQALLDVAAYHVRQNVKGTPDERGILGPSS